MSVRDLYDSHASKWRRDKPESLSDFTGRPAVFDMCGDVSGLSILDLGCGEGYCARYLSQAGAAQVLGIDISEQMVRLAEQQAGAGMRFLVGDIADLDLADQQFDLVLAMFVFNYTSCDAMTSAMGEAHRLLRSGGRFVFAVPHPAMAWMQKNPTRPFYFDIGEQDYFGARDCEAKGEIYRTDGQALPVRMIHKTVQDYFDALGAAGFNQLPTVRELGVRPEHMSGDPEFFGPVAGLPLHLAVSIRKD